jgi:hypothetical protein
LLLLLLLLLPLLLLLLLLHHRVRLCLDSASSRCLATQNHPDLSTIQASAESAVKTFPS